MDHIFEIVTYTFFSSKNFESILIYMDILNTAHDDILNTAQIFVYYGTNTI